MVRLLLTLFAFAWVIPLQAASPRAQESCAKDFAAIVDPFAFAGDSLGQTAVRLKRVFEENAYNSPERRETAITAARDLPPLRLRYEESEAAGLERFFSSLFPGQKVRLSAPSTAGMSGNPVWIVMVDEEPQFVAKAYKTGPLEFANELVGQQAVRELGPRNFELPQPAAAFLLEGEGKSYPLLVIRAVPGTDARTTLLALAKTPRQTAEAKAATVRVARALGEMHRKTMRRVRAGSGLQRYIQYETLKASEYSARLMNRHELVGRGWLSEGERQALGRRMNEMISAFTEKPPAHSALIHGDFHGGNVFPGQEQATIIDLESAALGLRRSADGRTVSDSDPRSDVARFLESIAANLASERDGTDFAAELEQEFLRAYAKESGLPLAELAEGLTFHRLRFNLLQLSQDSSLPALGQCMVLDRLLRQLSVRPADRPSPCR